MRQPQNARGSKTNTSDEKEATPKCKGLNKKIPGRKRVSKKLALSN
jgi:hypothetical protein